MNNYKPPYTLTDNILNLVSLITEKITKVSSYHQLDTKPQLRKNNKITSIHSSLKIEANSLSLGQVRDIIDGKLVLGSQKEIQEVKNAYKAYDMIQSTNPYSIDELKTIHGMMTDMLALDAGQFRTGEEGVFSGDECIFMAPPPHLVNHLMEQLFQWMNDDKVIVHPLIMSAVFHYEFVFIHPFSDGNGRVARLWHTILLSKWNELFEYIPLESQIQRFQEGYYKAIADSNNAGNSTIFIEFILTELNNILDEMIEESSYVSEDVSQYVERLLDVMEYNVPYNTVSIMDKLGLKSRETFRKNYLDPALDAGLVVRTIPDKPQSKNQRYKKV